MCNVGGGEGLCVMRVEERGLCVMRVEGRGLCVMRVEEGLMCDALLYMLLCGCIVTIVMHTPHTLHTHTHTTHTCAYTCTSHTGSQVHAHSGGSCPCT